MGNLPLPPGLTTPEGVRNLHNRDDVDGSIQAHHHTLGVGANQSFPGSRGKRLEDIVNENDEATIALIAALQAELDATQADLAAYKTRIGKTTYWAGVGVTSLPTAPANPYTSISGFTNQYGDAPAGLAYQGLGIWNCTIAGSYLFEANFGLAANAVGRRILFLYKNGLVDELRRLNDNAGVSVGTFNAMTILRLAVNDTIELRFFQDSGAALNMEPSGNINEHGADQSRMITVTVLR